MRIEQTHLNHGGKALNLPDIIVIHSMAEFVVSGKYNDHAVKFLDKVGLSAHALAAPDGTMYRCREDQERAYHAKGFNRNSLGIEFLVPGKYNYIRFLDRIKTPYLEEAQYQAGLAQVRQWCDAWPIQKIVRHSDLSPKRKFDPGDGFPFEQFIQEIGL